MSATVLFNNVDLVVPSTQRHQSLKSYLLDLKNKTIKSELSILNVHHFEAVVGDKVCVIGRNGNGKTTFLKVLAGIYPVTSGSVWTIGTPTVVLASGIGLEDELTVSENIELSLIFKNVKTKKVKELKERVLSFCELDDQQEKQFKHLSSGFKSRLAFAIATCEKPEILILDEVLGGGDEFFMKKAKHHVIDNISSATTAFVCTHAPDEMIGICNRCIVFEKGRIVFDGSMEDGIHFYREQNSSGEI